jgi:hypothetical protein
MGSRFYAPFSDDELEFIERQIEKRKPKGRPPAEHKWEWVRRYYELMAELNNPDDLNGERSLSKIGICGLIDPRSGGRAVWNLIRPIVENDERILRRARSRRYPALYVLYLGARLAQLEPLGPKPLEQAVNKYPL